MQLAVNRVMAEGSLYDPDLAALAIKQSWGDLVEAAFLLRAYRTTLPRLYYSQPINTDHMHLPAAHFRHFLKKPPAAKKLGPTFDYVHRLLDFQSSPPKPTNSPPHRRKADPNEPTPRILTTLTEANLNQQDFLPSYPTASNQSSIHPTHRPTYPPTHLPNHLPSTSPANPSPPPASRDARLQNLARADEGFFALHGLLPPSGAMAITIPLRGEIRVWAMWRSGHLPGRTGDLRLPSQTSPSPKCRW